MKLIDAENLKKFFDIKGAKFEAESIVKTIDRMPIISQWFFLGEKLPKDDEPCLICYLDSDGELYVAEDVYYRDSKLKTWFGSSYVAWDYEEQEIVAWMPLPAPPEIGKKI